MDFKAVDPSKLAELRKPVAQEFKLKQLDDGQVELPTKKLYVVSFPTHSPSEHVTQAMKDDLGVEVIGEIEYPLDFCTMDSGACSQGSGELDGFYHVGGHDAEGNINPELWIHSCYRPTRKWFTSHVCSVVKFFGDVPW